MDAFRAFDSDRNGLLNCSELYGGVTWLGFEVKPADIHRIMKHGNKEKGHNGFINYEEFHTLFKPAYVSDQQYALVNP